MARLRPPMELALGGSFYGALVELSNGKKKAPLGRTLSFGFLFLPVPTTHEIFPRTPYQSQNFFPTTPSILTNSDT